MTNEQMMARAAGIAMVLAGCAVSPAYAASGTGASTARVLLPLTVSESASLDFGSIIPSTTATGHVSIEPEGTRSECTVGGCTGGFTPASFLITGSPDTVLGISHAGVSTNPITFTLTSGANSMTFGLILHTPSVTLSNAGIASFQIGGRVAVPANQPPGDYSGTFDVSVDYQ